MVVKTNPSVSLPLESAVSTLHHPTTRLELLPSAVFPPSPCLNCPHAPIHLQFRTPPSPPPHTCMLKLTNQVLGVEIN
jgi:hypothetical protein